MLWVFSARIDCVELHLSYVNGSETSIQQTCHCEVHCGEALTALCSDLGVVRDLLHLHFAAKMEGKPLGELINVVSNSLVNGE